MPDIKGQAIATSGKKPGSNPTGQNSSPGNPKVVKNDPVNVKGVSGDSFHGGQPSISGNKSKIQ